MDAAAADELRGLRARAYGPDADIADDAPALARLRELEAQAANASAPVEPAMPETSAEPAAPPEEAVAPSPEPGGAATGSQAEEPAGVTALDDATGAPTRRRGLRSRPVAIALAAVSVVAIVGVTATITSMQTRSGVYDAPVEAVLTVIPDAEVPAMFGRPDDDNKVFADFYGLTPVSASMAFNRGGRSDCMAVVETAGIATATANSFQGITYYGCGAGPFAPTISMIVSSELPEQLREHYPDGTALQFVLESDGVVVLSGAASEDEAATPAADGR